VLLLLEEQMRDCADREQAKELILENEEQILADCRDVLSENGSGDSVSLRLCEEYYPTRVYGDMALPSGEYLSLQICIGKAQGKNWWCVLYPPVCLSANSYRDQLSKAGFDGDQINLVSEDRGVRYAVKFKILEAVGSFFAKLF
jgi:stage II sporulation protein R